jgi:hypothetical protein
MNIASATKGVGIEICLEQEEQDHDLSGLLKTSAVRYAIKCFPFAEQVVLLAMLPVDAGIDPCASLLFRGYRRGPHTVHAVRCACGGYASGTNFRGIGRDMSMRLLWVLPGMFQNAGQRAGKRIYAPPDVVIVRCSFTFKGEAPWPM